MHQITVRQGITYSDGFSEIISVMICCLFMFFVSLVCKILFVCIFFILTFAVFLVILYYKYCTKSLARRLAPVTINLPLL